ncbi:unnamed protein product [Leptidea sinapis]|uniref:Uncharacterized protein n=1 Tax=Leptidea sinapis TaxID=189913 RepID=A0A5E4QU17_9NEOP|nr:unnamed protein product [Leptidea sinapis]
MDSGAVSINYTLKITSSKKLAGRVMASIAQVPDDTHHMGTTPHSSQPYNTVAIINYYCFSATITSFSYNKNKVQPKCGTYSALFSDRIDRVWEEKPLRKEFSNITKVEAVDEDGVDSVRFCIQQHIKIIANTSINTVYVALHT